MNNSEKKDNKQTTNLMEDIYSIEQLKTIVDKKGNTQAHLLAKQGKTTKNKEILKLRNKDGETVAHILTEYGELIEDKEILKLADNYGWTVAHNIALQGHKITDMDLLRLKDNDDITVAHILANQGFMFRNRDMWKWANKNGWTVAHIMAENGYLFTEPEIWKLKTKNGITVASILATNGYILDENKLIDYKLLNVQDDYDITIGHWFTYYGYTFFKGIKKLADIECNGKFFGELDFSQINTYDYITSLYNLTFTTQLAKVRNYDNIKLTKIRLDLKDKLKLSDDSVVLKKFEFFTTLNNEIKKYLLKQDIC
ncbi:hypothetical protein DEFDS_P139 (plasmid) [Deferribacter desulfuricans SSM1]|uniref:Ankyrin repeat protein n=1 Tax=Deferribacter desulfuricans (strain DSM 14783 / JCM 11476 / NBRC 101012 / SSM1) TaxID=639282 RepID=D3PEW9_DEFDS|nr:ankyrin repeat domain-containing protein [Deferribacter desulfuricans]BAI81761.1 hypothetical protein DEFDS_P139 [Deferribacter desulfuricans SSM1]